MSAPNRSRAPAGFEVASETLDVGPAHVEQAPGPSPEPGAFEERPGQGQRVSTVA